MRTENSRINTIVIENERKPLLIKEFSIADLFQK